MKPRILDQGGPVRLLGLLICLGVSLLGSRVSAATFNVSDGDVAGLVNAIAGANVNGQDDTINLAADGTYTLTAADNSETGPNGLPIVRTDGGHTITFNGNAATIARAA